MCKTVQGSDEKTDHASCKLELDVDRLGLTVQTGQKRGCLEDQNWLKEIVVPNYHSHFYPAVYIDLPYKKLTCIRKVSQGKFGYIDLAKWETKDTVKEVYVKRPIHENTSLLIEACIQHVVRNGLKRFGFLNHVPRVIEVFELLDGSVCFAMDQVEGAITLDTYFNHYPSHDLSGCMIEILYQVVMMVWFMNHGLGMNHRDLKPSNFLIRVQDTVEKYSFMLDQLPVEWVTTYHLHLIDFGFACGGSRDTHQSYLSLSTVYADSDPCPKDGRDLFLFLTLLYADYHSRMSSTLRALFESWIEIKGSNLCAFIQKDKMMAIRWLYFLSGSPNVKSLPCCPRKVITDLLHLRNVYKS
jgi:serine/threonine protein kinase